MAKQPASLYRDGEKLGACQDVDVVGRRGRGSDSMADVNHFMIAPYFLLASHLFSNALHESTTAQNVQRVQPVERRPPAFPPPLASLLSWGQSLASPSPRPPSIPTNRPSSSAPSTGPRGRSQPKRAHARARLEFGIPSASPSCAPPSLLLLDTGRDLSPCSG